MGDRTDGTFTIPFSFTDSPCKRQVPILNHRAKEGVYKDALPDQPSSPHHIYNVIIYPYILHSSALRPALHSVIVGKYGESVAPRSLGIKFCSFMSRGWAQSFRLSRFATSLLFDREKVT